MPLVMNNFVRTSLRAPISALDTSIPLAAGGGAFFDIPPGSYCYITVNDSTKAEIMKYVSTGSVINDVIQVVRGQDNTVAQDFPAGSCIAESWNVAQERGYVQQLIDGTPTPNNTMATSGMPVAPPAVNIHYAIDIATGQLWYFSSPVWVPIVSNGVLVLTQNPIAPPPGGVTWAVNSITNILFFWTGSAWLLISGAGAGGLLESNGREYLNLTGVNLIPGNYAFAQLQQAPLNLTFNTVIDYKSNPAAVNIIYVPTVGPDAFKFQIFANSICEIDAAVLGVTTTPASALEMYLVLTQTASASAYGSSLYRPAGSTQTSVSMNVSTGPVAIGPLAPGGFDVWDANLVVVGPSDFTLTNAHITVSMMVLTV